MDTKKCLHCFEEFFPSNGNAKYCCNEHYKLAKKLRQMGIHALIKDFKNGYYRNFKLFNKLLPGKGTTSISVMDAKERGFNEMAFYRIAKDSGNWDWYRVSDYWFTVKADNQELVIYK